MFFKRRSINPVVLVSEGTVQDLKKAIRKGLNVDYKDFEHGWTLLMYAAQNGNIEKVRLLLEAGADVNALDYYSYTALIRIVSKHYFDNNHLDTMKVLIDKNADINHQDRDGYTALNWAASRGFTDAVKLLVDKGADITIQSNDGKTPYDVATNTTIKNILRGGNEVSSGELLLKAVQDENINKLKDLLKSTTVDIDFNILNGWTPLMVAIEKRNIEIIRLLLNAGASVTSRTEDREETPLLIAAMFLYYEAIKLLLEHGADINDTNYTGSSVLIHAISPLPFADKDKKTQVLELLLENGAKDTVNVFGKNALGIAEKKDYKSVELIRKYTDK